MLFNKKQRTKIVDLAVEEKNLLEMTEITDKQTELIIGGMPSRFGCTCPNTCSPCGDDDH